MIKEQHIDEQAVYRRAKLSIFADEKVVLRMAIARVKAAISA